MTDKRTVLNFQQGSSDKTYIVEMVAAAGGLFVVNFAYGRRGSTLKTDTKTKSPVSEAEADKIYNSIVKRQTGKGYRAETDASTGSSFSVEGIAPTRFPVHLLNEIEEKRALELLADDDYYAQEKHDGERRVIVLENGEIYGSNKRGLRVGVDGNFIAGIAELCDIFGDKGRELSKLAIDGEMVGNTFFAFDLLEFNDTDFRGREYYQRFAGLEGLFLDAGKNSLFAEKVVLSKLAVGTEEKTALFNSVKDGEREGIVFKHARSVYQPGLSKTQFKFKFYQDATCLVAGHHPTKASISLQVAGAGGSFINIGNCKVPPNHPFPAIGSLVDIRYMHAFPNGGSLYQPVYQRARQDKTEADSYDSLKFKPGAAVVSVA